IGNAFLQDDGFGGEVVRRLRQRTPREGVTLGHLGTGGLDLAYEVMRGYDALVLVDVSRQGGEPGTLYVMEAREEDVAADIEDGAMVDPHGMAPATVLRLLRAVGGWPGRVLVIACEPASVEDVGMGLTPEVAAAVDRAVALVAETVAELQRDAAYAG